MRYNSKRVVYGVGINDADYPVKHKVTSENGETRVVVCPFYRRWVDMLKRCHCPLEQSRYPNYIGCTSFSEWSLFSNFKAWMEQQDWEGNHLDKDILVRDNKLYSPETCVFVHPKINVFLTSSVRARGNLPLGVSSKQGKFAAYCSDPFKISVRQIGYFKTPDCAHRAWQERKHKYACQLAESEYVTDERVAGALRNRYKPEEIHF